MLFLTEADMVFIPVITGIVNIFKNIGLDSKFAPLISLCLGVFLCLLFSTKIPLSARVLKGIILGLSASGFYTNGKSIMEKVKPTDKYAEINSKAVENEANNEANNDDNNEDDHNYNSDENNKTS